MTPTRDVFSGRFRAAALTLALASALGASLAAGEKAENADAQGPSRSKLGNTIPVFQVSKRMYDKPADFFKRVRGGAEFKKFYSTRKTSRDKRESRNKPDDAVLYPMGEKDSPPKAMVYRPPAYDEAGGKGWGLLIMLQMDQNKGVVELVKLEDDFKEMLDRLKLVYVHPIPGGELDDLRNMAVVLDLTASLREEFPALGTKAGVKRTFVGGVGDGGRLAGLLAFNFPMHYAGYLGIQGMAMPFSHTLDNTFRKDGKSWFTSDFPSDMPYFDSKDFKKMKSATRIVLYNNLPPDTRAPVEMRNAALGFEMAVGGNKFNREGFGIRFFDQIETMRGMYPTVDLLEKGLRFLDGDKKVEQPDMPTCKARGVIWRQ